MVLLFIKRKRLGKRRVSESVNRRWDIIGGNRKGLSFIECRGSEKVNFRASGLK